MTYRTTHRFLVWRWPEIAGVREDGDPCGMYVLPDRIRVDAGRCNTRVAWAADEAALRSVGCVKREVRS